MSVGMQAEGKGLLCSHTLPNLGALCSIVMEFAFATFCRKTLKKSASRIAYAYSKSLVDCVVVEES